MKDKQPWFRFFPEKWLSSKKIACMTLEQQGAYLRLLLHSIGDGLPDDDNALAILSGLGEGWFKGGSTKIRPCFITIDGMLHNERLLEEQKRYKNWQTKSAQGGKASAKSRINKGRLKGGSRVVEGWSNDKELELDKEKEVDKEKTKKHICIYDHWNSLTHTTKHRTLTDRMKRAINGRFKEQYTAEEICTAITNYDFVIGSDKHYFSYKWPLDLFMSRSNGFPSFVDSADPRENYMRRELKEEQASKAASNKGTIEDIKRRLGMYVEEGEI